MYENSFDINFFFLLSRPSCYSCVRVNTLKSTADAVIDKLLRILQEQRAENGNGHVNISGSSDIGMRQSSFTTNTIQSQNLDNCGEVASGNVENVPNVLNESSQKVPITKCQIPGLDYVLFVRGSGPHTIDYSYADGKPPKEVTVSRKCAEAVLRGAQVGLLQKFD